MKRVLVYKILPAAALFGAWFFLVYTGRAEAQSFIGAIQAALIGMGIYHATQSTPGDKP
ncbi:MAG: hypothetical protein M0Z99_20425 [Betaproteobacteria bacterium]|nr:hypothetical protein [Betaproteobacteria bacterium]